MQEVNEVRRKQFKSPPLRRHPDDLPYCIELKSKDTDRVHKEAKAVLEFMKNDPEQRFHLDDCTYMPPNPEMWQVIKEEFPFIWEFKQRYKMSDLMMFVSYINPIGYSHRPHTHNTPSGAALFLTIKYSEGAATAFYKPKQENVLAYTYEFGSGWTTTSEECFDTEPDYIVQMNTPHVLALNAFHKPIETIPGHPDNLERVTMNWATKLRFEKFADKINT